MVDPAYVLAMMLALEPSSPWRESFEDTAAAIAREAHRSPLPGLGEQRTAALLVSLAWFESTFRPDAEGDCLGRDGVVVESLSGRCPPGSRPRSFGLYQVHESNFAALRITKADVVRADTATPIALRLVAASFRACAGRPIEERLSQYAGGGGTCPKGLDARRKSAHRVERAVSLHRLTRMPQESFPGGTPPLDPSLPGQDVLGRPGGPR